jgi:hypothetical protein
VIAGGEQAALEMTIPAGAFALLINSKRMAHRTGTDIVGSSHLTRTKRSSKARHFS